VRAGGIVLDESVIGSQEFRDWREVGAAVSGDIGDLWVFGYGSLMWKPGFDHDEAVPALVRGYRRTLCVRSYVHRGTRERPGLVLGLDRGGSCRGVAFRVSSGSDTVVAYLRERELVTNVYLERRLAIRLADGRAVKALTYIVDRNHEQYAGILKADEAAGIVAASSGVSGDNPHYVLSTLAHLRAMGIHDKRLEDVAGRLSVSP
jgi:glutathione-specific gamma-glutamylcyclotransferase